MDARPNSSSKIPCPVQHTPPIHNPRTLSYNGNEGITRVTSVGGRPEAMLRREHSDGEVFGANSNARLGPGRYQNDPIFSASARDSVAHRGNVVDAARRMEAARQSGFPAYITAGRKAIIEDNARRRSATHQSLRGSAASGMEFPSRSDDHPLLTAPSGAANLFPSTDLNRPLPPRPNRDHLSNRRSREIVLPRWQPDVEVNTCPICQTVFSFWYRKHHCRKCGRVVCANCSPHRITIPRQFIVHPPEDATPDPESTNNERPSVIDSTSDDEAGRIPLANGERPRTADYTIDPALGGGQEVRLCNPCVPDPNPMPPPLYGPVSQSPNPSILPDQMPSSQRPPYHFDHGISVNEQHAIRNGSHSNRMGHRLSNGWTSNANTRSPITAETPVEAGPSDGGHLQRAPAAISPNPSPLMFGSAPDQLAQERYLDGLVQRRRSSHHPSHRQHASFSGPPTGHSHPYWSEEFDFPAPRAAPPPQPPPSQLREEDECPICHGALPPKGADGSETAREAHVSGCIETHFSSSGPRTSRPHPSTATDAAVIATTATPSQASGMARTQGSRSSPSSDRPSPAFFQQRRRTTGMVVYHATEKDCVGEDGREAECVICFEEFSVGDEMGRLECLCKFHKACIRQWWDTKGPGACPVHQQQEGG